MKLRITSIWFFILVMAQSSSFGDAEDTAKLPDQYAQAVLNVEGML